MTQLFERAVSEVSRLPASEQDALAALLLAEIESERRWSNAFADSSAELETLADEALAELAAGETLPMKLERDFPHD